MTQSDDTIKVEQTKLRANQRRLKAELEKIYKCVAKMEEKARQNDVKGGNEQQTEKTDNRKSTTVHEDFIKEKFIDETGKTEVLTGKKSQLSSGLSQRPGSVETLLKASNQSNDFANQQLRQRIAELEMEALTLKQRFSEQFLIPNAGEAARLTEELCERSKKYLCPVRNDR